MSTYMGLDLSLVETGWCVFEEHGDDVLEIHYGTIKTKKKDFNDDIDRYLSINKNIMHLVKDMNPDIVSIEDVFGGPNGKTTKKLYQLGGIIRASLRMENYDFMDIAPTTLKKHVTGRGNAKKEDVMNVINNTFDLKITNNNISDAIGLATFGFVKTPYDKDSIKK